MLRTGRLERSGNYDDRVMDQSCADYLKFMGFEVADGEGINCPYRPSSDSGSFIVNGAVFYDHARGEGGNVWQLALKMNGDNKRTALESLYKSAGVPFIPNPIIEKRITDRDIAHQALRKVYDAFRISASTPIHVVDYLDSRKVGDLTRPYFGFIPKGRLSSVLSEAEIDMTGLRNREELIILWYFTNAEPVYYCTRSIDTKEFKKASRDNGILSHPIWNGDSLYSDEHVVWGEGMFDCTSLIELGFGVAGEITCNIINEHRPDLLTALRWRAKHHPEWTFTICLDNDKITETGKRPGNEAAEKLALWLWGNGVDVKWVKHDPDPSAEKVDINKLHQNGMGSAVKKMIEEAKYISEVLGYDEELCLRNFTRLLTQQDYRGASRLMGIMEKQTDNAKIKTILEMTHKIPWDWREVYADEVKEVFLYCGDIYVVFDKGRFGESQKHYEVFKTADFVRNMRCFQVNPLHQLTLADLDLRYRRPTWKVSRGAQTSKDEYNLFEPSPLLLQQAKDGAPLPDQWNKLMDNLAGSSEKEWLLNHMATYVQTLDKPRTIPVFVGKQGTGKTKCVELFGKGIGGFMAVDNGLIESDFNGYLMNAVVLLDELANSQRDSNQLKNRLKQFINERQSINAKHRNVISVELNNYIVIASNEQTSHVPLVIEEDDRRYSIISGGVDRNLAHESWFNYQELEGQLPAFMLYLLSRPIDVKAASIPLMTEMKQQLADSSQDYKTACVRAFIEEMQDTIAAPQIMKLSQFCDKLNEKYNPQFRYMPRSVKPILEGLKLKMTISHKQCVVTVEPYKGDGVSDGDDNSGSVGLEEGEDAFSPPSDTDWAAHESFGSVKTEDEDLFKQ